MKLVIDEKLKHRLIGLAVIISLGAIFAPAVMKKSSQHLENNFSVNVKLPPKPIVPNVVITDENEVFKTIKVSRAAIQPSDDSKQDAELAKAQSITSARAEVDRTAVASKAEADGKSAPVRLAVNKVTQPAAKQVIKVAAVKAVKKAPIIAARPRPANKPQLAQAAKAYGKKEVYAVQLASFSQLTNAQALVSRLRNKGYKANFMKTTGRDGAVYKVHVGHSPNKIEAMKLKTQLASSMQLNGFVVNTGVS